MDPRKLTIGLTLSFFSTVAAFGAAVAPEVPGSVAAVSASDNLLLSPEASDIEEGKALYESGQLIAALGKFMNVLRKDPHNDDARQYLRMIVDTMRQNPAITASKLGTREQAVTANPVVQEEIRRMLQLRSRLTLDLRAIPGVHVDIQRNVNQVWIESPILFGENSGGLKEQGVPILDRAAAWLKTYGQQPIIIHCYPEEFQESGANGSLFLHRYSELFNFFVQERKLSPQRFVSADLLHSSPPSAPVGGPSNGTMVSPPATAGNDDNKAPRIVIETIGAQSAMLEAMPGTATGGTSSAWLENSITPSRRVFNPEEGEWVNFDLSALTRTGLRDWAFTITSAQGTSAAPVFQMDGKGNLLKRVGWDGHDQKTGNFVPAGSFLARLTAANSDGTIKKQEEVLQVERTTKEEAVVAEKPKPKRNGMPRRKNRK